MAQHKYDLLLVPHNSDKVIHQQPWYKERLQTKYIKQKSKGSSSECLIGRNWTFLQTGLDDFRDGLPPNTGGQFVLEGSRGISPVISQSNASPSRRIRKGAAEGRPCPALTKWQTCYSNKLPLQQKKADHVDEVEFGLTHHPLALYPHLEEGMPPELFEDVVDLLDPAMNPDFESEEGSSPGDLDQKTTTEGSGLPTTAPDDETNVEMKSVEEESQTPWDESKCRNPYKWILRKDSAQKDDKKGYKKRPTSPSQDEHIKEVTKDFCNWVADLGGDSNNVEESTIMSLFASGYETKPALSVPIHVVELSNVPAELRISAGISPRGSARKSQTTPAAPTHQTRPPNTAQYEPSWVKVKYGAWYLEPATWKVRTEDEPLEDPEEIAKREMSESKKKSNEMDAQLAPLHGARAFRKFLERKERRKPDFMNRVTTLQDAEDTKKDGNAPNSSVYRDRVDSTSRGSILLRSVMTGRSSASTMGLR